MGGKSSSGFAKTQEIIQKIVAEWGEDLKGNGHQDAKDLWDAYDLEGTGFLERGEGTAFFKDIYRRKLQTTTDEQKLQMSKSIKTERDLEQWAQHCFDRMDRGHGRISWEEFYSYASECSKYDDAKQQRARMRITGFFRGWAEGLRVRIKIYRWALAEIESREERKALYESKKQRELRKKIQ